MRGPFRHDIMERIERHQFEVKHVGREIAKWWNERRRNDDVRLFCGWYWLRAGEEAGPFPTRSAAYRDVYYKLVLNRDPPRAMPQNVVKLRRGRKVA